MLACCGDASKFVVHSAPRSKPEGIQRWTHKCIPGGVASRSEVCGLGHLKSISRGENCARRGADFGFRSSLSKYSKDWSNRPAKWCRAKRSGNASGLTV